MPNYLGLNSDGSFQEIQPIVVSLGSASAGSIPALNSNGKIDSSMISNNSNILAFAAAHG